MKKLLSLLPILPIIFLAACNKPLEVNTITPIQPTNGSKSIDVYAEKRLTSEDVPRFAGDQIVDLRSYSANKNGSRGKEFAGASCEVEARDFRAKALTPAKIRLPIYRGQSSPLAVTCTHAEHKPKLVERSVYNHTKQQRIAAGSQAGLLGFVVMAVVNEASDESNDDYYYRQIDVVMTPQPAHKSDAAMPAAAAGAAGENKN